MQVRTIRWTKRALRCLDRIGTCIAKDNPQAAGHVMTRILSSVETLAAHPALGRPGRITGTRENVVTGLPCIVAYRVTPESVDILTILHGAQQWPETI